MRLSVVVTIGRREDSVLRVIDAISNQNLPRDDYEVIFVDRTPDDHYASAIPDAATSGARFVYETAPDWSRARANNIGLRSSSHEVLCFLADDFIPPPDVFAGHLKFHRRAPEVWRGVIGPAGRTEGRQTDLSGWHEQKVGPFRPPPGADVDDISPFNVSFTNTSVKRAFLVEHGTFDEDFVGEGFEDIELALRLHARGLRFSFDPRLHVIHDHDIEMREMLARWRICGQMARIFDAKHPGRRSNIEPQDAMQSLTRGRYESARSRLKAFASRSATARERAYLKQLQLAFVRGYAEPPGPINYPYELEHVARH